MEGTRIGAYLVESELGTGGMGTVWLAEVADEHAVVPRGTRVAVKVVHPHLIGQSGFFERFMREAEVGQQVDHENVVRTLDVDALEVDGTTTHFLVMEYVEGRTLRDLLHDLGTVPEALLREIARQVAAGLSAIHEAGVVHRDLKPENILVTHDHQVRIMDLGVARLVEQSVALTKRGEFAGSLLYAAPEQFGSEPVGPAADLYSFGVLLYELAAGENPFLRDSAGQVVAAQLNETPRSITQHGAEVSLFFAEILNALLAKRPEARIESAAVLHDLLEQGENSTWWAARMQALIEARGHLPEVPVRRETELYGRESELTILRGAWARARRGEGNIILLEGEAGIGKTRLVDSFLKGLEGKGAHVLYGSYPPSGGMGGISDAITAHFGLVGLEGALAPYFTVTPSLLPTFAALVKHESPPTGSEPIQGDALHAVMVNLMRGLAEEKPLVWVIDDLHFSSPDSRRIALSLARAVEGHRVLLLTTSRPGLPDDEIAHFSRLENHRRVDLGRLSPREVIQLLRDAFGSEALAEKLGGKIAYKSDGVPFFVFEMIRGLRESRRIQEDANGTWVETQVINEIEVPSAVRELIEARLGDLSREERAILDVASVLGFEFDTNLVGRVLERKRIGVLQDLAEIERRSGVVRGGAGCRFDHHQIQEVIYEGLMPDLRTEYHALLAEAYGEGVAGEAANEDAVFLASHHLRGSRPEAGLPHLVPALEYMEKAYGNLAAIELAEYALDRPGLIEGEERAEALLKKGKRESLLGRWRELRSTLDEAVDLAAASGNGELNARALIALGAHLSQTSDYATAREHLEHALAAAIETGNKRVEGQAAGNLGLVFLNLCRYDEARSRHERCLALAHEVGDVNSVAASTINLGLVFQYQGRYEEARAQYEEGLVKARDCRNRLCQAGAIANLGVVLSYLGRHDEARAHCEKELALAREIGNRRGEANATGRLGYLLQGVGDYAESLAQYETWLARAREMGDRLGEGFALVNMGPVLAAFGETELAELALDRSLRVLREIGARRPEGYALHELGSVAEQRGKTEAARHLFEEALALRRAISYQSGVASTLIALGLLERATGEDETAAVHLDEALELARELNAPGTILSATVARARLPDGDVEEALLTLDEHAERATHAENMEARFRVWELTRDTVHLGEAHRLLDFLRDHTPIEYRETMTTNVPLHRDILAAWKEQGA
jgi:tetratricopeptide (TPR) repeat protein/tRNA A-37 threonylcarbamoyl transferase component Bud32